MSQLSEKEPNNDKNVNNTDDLSQNDVLNDYNGKNREISDDNISLDQSESKKNWLQVLKFTLFSISAGVIQLLSFELLYNWIGWHVWWGAYLISVVLSVLWNFTFNRKFTFKSSNNVPLAMILVLAYYCVFTPISVFGGGALENIGWNGTLVTILMMLINFVTEFLYDKFVVFNDKIFKKK